MAFCFLIRKDGFDKGNGLPLSERKSEKNKKMISWFAGLPEAGKMTLTLVIYLAKWAGSCEPISEKFLALERINVIKLCTKNQDDI